MIPLLFSDLIILKGLKLIMKRYTLLFLHFTLFLYWSHQFKINRDVTGDLITGPGITNFCDNDQECSCNRSTAYKENPNACLIGDLPGKQQICVSVGE